MKSKLFFVALLFLFNRSYSQWEKVTTSPDSTIYFVNPLYVSEVKDYQGNAYKKAWVKITSKKFTAGDGTEYYDVEIKSLYWFDCVNLRQKLLSFVMSKSTGEVILNNDVHSDATVPWSNIAPESIAELLAKRICSIKK